MPVSEPITSWSLASCCPPTWLCRMHHCYAADQQERAGRQCHASCPGHAAIALRGRREACGTAPPRFACIASARLKCSHCHVTSQLMPKLALHDAPADPPLWLQEPAVDHRRSPIQELILQRDAMRSLPACQSDAELRLVSLRAPAAARRASRGRDPRTWSGRTAALTMIVDSAAVVAIRLGEPAGDALAGALAGAKMPMIGAANGLSALRVIAVGSPEVDRRRVRCPSSAPGRCE